MRRKLPFVLLVLLLTGEVRALPPTSLVFENVGVPGKKPGTKNVRIEEAARPWMASQMEFFGLTEPGPPIRVLLASEDSPQALSAPSWVAGYTDGVSDVVVLLPGRTPSYPDNALEDVLAHEVAHVLIARASAGYPVPRWFNEGLAMMAGRSWGMRDRAELGLGLLSSERVPLWKLDDLFQGERSRVEKAYALSGALVQEMLERSGSGLPRALLSRIARGLTFDEALREATGSTLIELGETFYAKQTVWRRWLPLVTSGALLWFGITMLAVVASLKRRAQKRAALEAQGAREDSERAPLEDPLEFSDAPPFLSTLPPHLEDEPKPPRPDDWSIN